MEKKKISVAFFLPSLEPGGTERNVVNLVNNIDRAKYATSLVLGQKEGDFIKEVHSDIPIVTLSASNSLYLFFKLIRYFKQQKPDVFISAFPRINVVCIAAKIYSRVNTKVVVTEHSVFSLLPVIAKNMWRGTFARFFMPTLCRLMYPCADTIICVSEGIKADLVKILGSSKKIEVIYNPVIDEKVYKLAAKPVSHPWFSDSKIPIIIAAGRLVACKDYSTLINAFNMVQKNQPARLVILGRGPKKEELMRLIETMGLAGSVAFLGFQENPYAYMKKASVFALASLQEGFGNVIIEAMACQVPVVSTNCPTGPGEIIEHMKNGILVSMGDAQSMAVEIIKILQNPVLAKTLSREGTKRADFFSVTKSVREYEKVFLRVMHNV